mmetsp:Transcript_22578/g.29249  ORF Transcript_22578/g.29249 Transcript_22578/m.29249 type:complete len:419 (-) Transcript_22578:1336-2592(-)
MILEKRREFAVTIKTWADDFVNAMFMFCLFSARIAVVPLWFTYVPLLSPVFGQGEVWWASRRLKKGISVHVLCGIVCLLCALFQLDQKFRRENPRVHRWLGRLYLLTGLLTIGSLQHLQSGVGQGPGTEPSKAMQIFVDCSSLSWLLTSFAAWIFARFQNFKLHRRCAIISTLIMCVPITQRLAEWALATPSVIAVKLMADAARGVAPWHSRWPKPTEALILSTTGYGVAEHVAFPLSAWLGLLLTIIFSIQAVRYDDFISHDLSALEPLKKFILTCRSVSNDILQGQADLYGLVSRRRAAIQLDKSTKTSSCISFFIALLRSFGLGLELVAISIALVVGFVSIVGFFILAVCHIVFLFELLPGLTLSLPIFLMKKFAPAWFFLGDHDRESSSSLSVAVLSLLHTRAGESSVEALHVN